MKKSFSLFAVLFIALTSAFGQKVATYTAFVDTAKREVIVTISGGNQKTPPSIGTALNLEWGMPQMKSLAEWMPELWQSYSAISGKEFNKSSHVQPATYLWVEKDTTQFRTIYDLTIGARLPIVWIKSSKRKTKLRLGLTEAQYRAILEHELLFWTEDKNGNVLSNAKLYFGK